MMKDASAHADEDKTRREEIETRNRADQGVYAAEKMLQDMGEKLGAEDKAAVEGAVETLKAAVAANNTADMNSAMEQLTQAQHKAAEALYKQPDATGADGAAESAEGSSEAQGDVIDAEVVDEEKK